MNRLNIIVSSAASSAAVQEIRKWCATLDQEDSDREQIYIYQIVNGRADMLKSAISTMFTVTGSMVDKD